MTRAAVFLALFPVLVPMLAAPALAGEPEARDVARQSNCSPNRIDPVRDVPGATGSTVYKVTCDGKAKNQILIECQESQCVLLR